MVFYITIKPNRTRGRSSAAGRKRCRKKGGWLLFLELTAHGMMAAYSALQMQRHVVEDQ
jgi:hypothetical protein